MVFITPPSFILLAITTTMATTTHASSTASWAGWGNGIFNNRWTPSQTINTSNIQTLAQHCRLIYDFRVPTPDVVRATFALSRTSPQIDGDVLYFGTQMHALLVAVDRHTGAVLGRRQINKHPYAVITMSPTVYRGVIFVGTASLEEGSTLFFPGYKCCTFIGNFAALTFSRTSGRFTTKWNIPMLPSSPSNNSLDDGTWSGAAIWGSQPAIDPARKTIFFATGNVYSLPSAYSHCASPDVTADCLPSNVYQTAILAVSIATGQIIWAYRTSPLDAFNGACLDVMFQGGVAVVGEWVMFGTGYRSPEIVDAYKGSGSFHVWRVNTVAGPRHGKE